MTSLLTMDRNLTLPEIGEKYLPMLDKAREGIMSPELKDAVDDCIEAMEAGQWYLVYEVSAVKGQICSEMCLPKGHKEMFREMAEVNEETLGHSLYDLLGAVHFETAMAIDAMPCNMVAFSNGHIDQKGAALTANRTVVRIKKDLDASMLRLGYRPKADGTGYEKP
jgi:hypothetical protein